MKNTALALAALFALACGPAPSGEPSAAADPTGGSGSSKCYGCLAAHELPEQYGDGRSMFGECDVDNCGAQSGDDDVDVECGCCGGFCYWARTECVDGICT